MIEILLPSGMDLDATDQNTVVVETDRPDVFVEFQFEPGSLKLSAVSVQDWTGVRRA